MLSGRLVTIDAQDKVHDRGLVCIEDGVVRAVVSRGAATPPEFAGVAPVATGGTIYPGLIELHNHLPYNVLRLWQAPKRFTNCVAARRPLGPRASCSRAPKVNDMVHR